MFRYVRIANRQDELLKYFEKSNVKDVTSWKLYSGTYSKVEVKNGVDPSILERMVFAFELWRI